MSTSTFMPCWNAETRKFSLPEALSLFEQQPSRELVSVTISKRV